jgi:hypothetical protein
MVCGEWNHKVHALPPQGADEPLAECIGLRSPYRRLKHPQPQVADALVQLLREDTITVMNQESVGMVSGHRFAQLLQGPRRYRVRRDIGISNPSCYLLKSMGFFLTVMVKSPISPQEEPAHGRQNGRAVLSV